MKITNEVLLFLYAPRTRELIGRIKDFLESINYSESDGLPNDIGGENKQISIVFVGQYNAGKSTIIRTLTGRTDIAADVGTTTEETQAYDWNGLTVIDTPGIQTGIHPDHDKKAYDAIAGADIIAYVVTQTMFNDDIGMNFRKLLEKHAPDKILLIVNKMDEAAAGNTAEAREKKFGDLERVTDPYKLKTEGPYASGSDIRCVFICANWYLASLQESDPKAAAYRLERSNYKGLVEALNGIAKDNKVYSRLTTPLYEAENILQEAIIECESPAGDKDADRMERDLLKKIRMYRDAKWKITSFIDRSVGDTYIRIREMGDEFSYDATSGEYKSEDALNTALQKMQLEVDDIVRKCVGEIDKRVTEILAENDEKVRESYASDNSGEWMKRMREELDRPDINVGPAGGGGIPKEIWERVRDFILRETEGISGAKAATVIEGSRICDALKKAGGLIKIDSDKIAKLSERIGTAFGKLKSWKGWLILIDLLRAWLDKRNADKLEKEFEKTRSGIRSAFNEAATVFKNAMDMEKDRIIKETCSDKISAINSLLADLSAEKVSRDENCKNLNALKNECAKLIREIMKAYAAI